MVSAVCSLILAVVDAQCQYSVIGRCKTVLEFYHFVFDHLLE